MSEQSSQSRKTRTIIARIIGVVLIVLLIIGNIAAKQIQKKREAEQLKAEQEENEARLRVLVKEFGPVMMENLPKGSKRFEYYEDAQVSAYAVWNGKGEIIDNIDVTIFADNKFDSISDRMKYEWLKWVYKEYGKRIKRVYDEKMKEYKRLLYYFSPRITLENAGKRSIIYTKIESYIIKTDENTYEWAGSIQDYYVLNGKDHFLKDKKSRWYNPPVTPTPTRRPSSSSNSSGNSSGNSFGNSSGKSSGKGFDYYDTYEYDDPEDFWYDYEDEFEDYEDAEDYWEEYHG